MARRAGRTVAAALTLAAIGLPAALLASQTPAAAAGSTRERSAQSQLSLAITSMNPQEAAPGDTITVTGTVTNSSRQPVSRLAVQLLGSRTPVSSTADLPPEDTTLGTTAGTLLPHGTWLASGPLQPGATASWSIQVKANSIGMTTFGVYPLTAQALPAADQSAPFQAPLAAATTYLPYVPSRKGPYRNSIPAQAKIAWILPLIDTPLLGQPWQNICRSPAAKTLVASLTSAGRLGQLVAAGAQTSAGTADAYSVAAGPQQTGTNRAYDSAPAESLSGYDGVTWAIDPALLSDVQALASCSSHPHWESTAARWLTQVRQVTSAEPMFVTPYADPDVAALVSSGRASDVHTSFALGEAIATRILHRDLVPSTAGTSSGSAGQAAAIAWPADGIDGYSTVENLAAQDDIGTLVVSSSAMPAETATVLQKANGSGGYMNVLRASDTLSRLLADGSKPGSAFATAQLFLAETALSAEQDPGAPIIVAPPHRWDPASGLTAHLLAETASAPWLSPASLTSLTAAKHIPRVRSVNDWAPFRSGISKRELRRISAVSGDISTLLSMAANKNNDLLLAISTVESSAWQGKSRSTALALLRTVTSSITQQEQDVQILAEPRVTLGGLKGSVPVSIDNRLNYPVQVKLVLSFSKATGMKISASPGEPINVPAHTAVTVKLHVQATEVGSTTITMNLQNGSGAQLPAQSISMTVEATQVGVLGVIICAAALGVFLIAYAARAARRARPAAGPGEPGGPGPGADQGGDHSIKPAEPDTVMAERTELGTAGAPGP